MDQGQSGSDADGAGSEDDAGSDLDSDPDGSAKPSPGSGAGQGVGSTPEAGNSDDGRSDQSDQDGESNQNADLDDDQVSRDSPNSSAGEEEEEEEEDTADTADIAGAASVVNVAIIGETDRRSSSDSITFGQVFAKGDVPAGSALVGTVDGGQVPMQVDKKATWADGSLRHAVITARMSDVGDGSPKRLSINVIPQARDAQTRPENAITLSDVLGSGFDAQVDVKASGAGNYKISAHDLLQTVSQSGNCSAWSKNCKQWLDGPLASEWIVSGQVISGNEALAGLNVYFNVRAYAGEDGAIERVRVDTVFENNWAYAKTSENIDYSASIQVGSQNYDVDDLKHYHHARWHKVLWWQGDPGLYARIDTDYLQNSGAISRYAKLSPPESFLNGVAKSYPPMSHGDQTPKMGSTGAQAAIGPLPRWTSSYAVSGDRRAFRWMLANDDAVGSYSFHYRDGETGRPLEISRHPYVTIAAKSFASRAGNPQYRRDFLTDCTGSCSTPLSFDIAHHPSIGYVPYLTTGDYYYLEEMQFTASYIELWANPGYRDFDKGVLLKAQSQVRGQAWSLRSISDAAFATPDDDPMKAYFEGLMSNILSDYSDSYLEDDTKNPLHVTANSGAVIYSAGGQKKVGVAPWQADFWTWSLGHAADQEMPNALELVKWFGEFQVARMTDWKVNPDSGFCWLLASAYNLRIRDAESSQLYPDIQTVYKVNFPQLDGLKCNSQPMVNELSDSKTTYRIGQMVGYAFSPTGFPSNFQIGLAMAAQSGVENGREAWKLFDGRTIKPDYAKNPNFAVVPRY
ncbi:hypothetical protein GCM10028792_20540 [Salinisphaera aquimarina]